MRWYGSLHNRLSENKNLTGKRYVGEDITKYLYSDSYCYYITRVIDDKHIFVKKYRVKCKECYTQNWEYIKDEKEPEIELIFKWKKWREIFVDFDGEKRMREFGNISFGVRDYNYDWSF